ncbi:MULTISPECIES: DsbA family oxidoreductase [Pseudomonas]|uniref:DsbA family oxidoreductase n=1 Tax=Pseudomonas TaxID=286 RepID=UPI0018ABC6D3|nr:DsbA family oxidoreductase [Pseudomonas guariconensis]MBF8755428.1 DsbA family oxidoreductase [Pseudomonas guariconensis]
MMQTVTLDVFFDFICPWCLIGQRHLDQALARLRREQPQRQVRVHWRGVQLLPGLAAEGVPFEAFYRERLGSDEAVRQRQAQVRDAASAVGEHIEFARIRRMPNTANAHRLLQRVQALGNRQQADALLMRLFAAYFHEGQDLGDRATLLAIAQGCGLMPAQVADCLREDARPFMGEQGRAAGGVPCFVVDRRRVVSGAQPADVLFEALCEAQPA